MKFLKRILLGVLIIYVLALMIDVFISKSFLRSSLFEGELNTWNDIYNKKIDEDLVIYGSSRSYVHLNPIILDKELKLNSYNLGFNGQKIELQKFRHDELISIGSHPKNVIINLDITSLEKARVFNPEQFIPLMLYRKSIYDIVGKELEFNYFDLYFPMIRYRKFKYQKVDVLKELYKIYFYSNYHNNGRVKGFKGMNYSWKERLYKPNFIEVDSLRKQDLFLIIEDLQKLNTSVILINSPEYIAQIESQINQNEVIKLYKSISEKYNIPFIDYSNDSMNYQKNLFYNSNHLNAKGADIFTKKLAEDIKPYIKR